MTEAAKNICMQAFLVCGHTLKPVGAISRNAITRLHGKIVFSSVRPESVSRN